MSDKETPREESASAAASSDEAPGKGASEEGGKRPADQCHGRYVEYYKQSLNAEGEVAYQRWGMPFFHSLPDEDVQTQFAALGLEPTDALDFYNRGCLLAAREDFAGAAKAFEHAAQLDPALADAVYNRALALELAGDLARARETWRTYQEQFGEAEDAEEVKDHLGSLAGA